MSYVENRHVDQFPARCRVLLVESSLENVADRKLNDGLDGIGSKLVSFVPTLALTFTIFMR